MNSDLHWSVVSALQDLGFVGPKFTWCNRRDDGNIIRARLDRALANEEWRGLYPIVRVEVLASRNLDHAPIILKFQKRQGRQKPYEKRFRYEARWGKKEVGEVIHQVWRKKSQEVSVWRAIKQNLESSKRSLICWDKENKRPTSN